MLCDMHGVIKTDTFYSQGLHIMYLERSFLLLTMVMT